MFTMSDNIVEVTETGKFYIGDISFIVKQLSKKLVTGKLELFNENTVFVNMYGTITRCATLIKKNYIKTVPIISNIGIIPLNEANKSQFKNDNSLGIEISLNKGTKIAIKDLGFDGLHLVLYYQSPSTGVSSIYIEYAKIPLNFNRD